MLFPIDLSPRGYQAIMPFDHAETDVRRAIQHGIGWCDPSQQPLLRAAYQEAERVSGAVRTHQEADRLLAWLGDDSPWGTVAGKRVTIHIRLMEAWMPHRIVRTFRAEERGAV